MSGLALVELLSATLESRAAEAVRVFIRLQACLCNFRISCCKREEDRRMGSCYEVLSKEQLQWALEAGVSLVFQVLAS